MSSPVKKISFKTNFAEYELIKLDDGTILESHCGFSEGCFFTEPQEIFTDDSLEDIKRKYLQMEGEYKG